MKKKRNPVTFAPRWSRGVSTEEWCERVMRLEVPLRSAVARIVWWDLFSLRLTAERFTGLDEALLKDGKFRTEDVGNEELLVGLIAIGYPPKAADYRIRAYLGISLNSPNNTTTTLQNNENEHTRAG